MAKIRVELIFAFAAAIGTTVPAFGQSAEPPNNAPFQAGPLVLAPVLRLANVGHDSNVFSRSKDQNPVGDVMATFSPSVDGWLRMAHARANGRSLFDVYYFKQLTDLRAVDSDNSGHIEVPINRVLAYATAALTSTTQRQNLEIDSLARRRNDAITVGMEVRVTAKLTGNLYSQRNRLRYDDNSLYLGTDLAQTLNHKSVGEGAELRYALTPLTSIAVGAIRTRDRFDFATDRDGNNTSVLASLRFSPVALVSGGVAVGVQKRTVIGGTGPDFNGTVTATDLGYTLLGRTRFAVSARRELEYSYVYVADYIRTGVNLGVNQRLGESWSVGGSMGRDNLSYRSRGGSLLSTPADENVNSSSGDIRYTLGHSQVGVQVDYRQRNANQALAYRGYDRLRIASMFSYAF